MALALRQAPATAHQRAVAIAFVTCGPDEQAAFPIEFAWRFVDLTNGDLGAGGAFLIRPDAVWDIPAAWSEASEALHRISRADLARDGVAAEVAATRVAAIVDGTDTVAVVPAREQRCWLHLAGAVGAHTTPPILEAAGLARELVAARTGLDAGTAAGAIRIAELVQRTQAQARRLSPPWHRAAAGADHVATMLALAGARDA